ncbi:hypothetical protein CA13_23970 [Planctomycetes bacterium CA13]|uniref:Uncharacterized protein n=1 Tax=Novipirellula herctigrandis TaxID=2527986 RepID=A0A5C5Z199_9BACT|nr:hypothetical protein CA13_23970 [Planctomycetes bacterium CA13]
MFDLDFPQILLARESRNLSGNSLAGKAFHMEKGLICFHFRKTERWNPPGGKRNHRRAKILDV